MGNWRMTWGISMWTKLFGENLRLSLFKLQFIWWKINRKTYHLSRINFWSLWSKLFGQLKNWSKIRLRSQVCPRLIGTSQCGEKHIHCVIEQSQWWNPKGCIFVGSVLYLGGISNATGQALKDKIKWYLETLSQRFGSNRRGVDGTRVETFSRIQNSGKSRWHSKGFGGIEVWIWATQKEGSSSCQWTITSHGEYETIVVWRIPGMLQHLPRGCCADVRHFWDLVVRGSATELMLASQIGEWNSTAEVMILSHQTRDLVRFADNNNIPWGPPTNFRPDLIATILQRCLLSLSTLSIAKCHRTLSWTSQSSRQIVLFHLLEELVHHVALICSRNLTLQNNLDWMFFGWLFVQFLSLKRTWLEDKFTTSFGCGSAFATILSVLMNNWTISMGIFPDLFDVFLDPIHNTKPRNTCLETGEHSETCITTSSPVLMNDLSRRFRDDSEDSRLERFKSVKLTPNINSQAYWPKVNSRVTNGTIFRRGCKKK